MAIVIIIALILATGGVGFYLGQPNSSSSSRTATTLTANQSSTTFSPSRQSSRLAENLSSSIASTSSKGVQIKGVRVAFTGPLSDYFQLTTPSFSNQSYSAGDDIPLNFSVLFLTSSDEGVSYNGSAALINVTVVTTGFQLVSVTLANSFKENPVFVTSNGLAQFTVTISTKTGGFAGPIDVRFDTEPT